MTSVLAPAHTHAAAVDRLLQSYAAVPQGARVRLAKRTSNLFRPRSRTTIPGLDVSGLGGVLSVDPVARTADVQGMCTYENLVEATLPYGLMPLVVPQLRTITLGGAVTGLGIESTSFRNGLPHESVLELDVLTGTGEVVTARPDSEHADLFRTFPNSYGSLGYATRIRIELQPIGRWVRTRNVRFDTMGDLVDAVGEVTTTGEWAGVPVDGMDGVVFDEATRYLTLATFTDDQPSETPSDYTGQQIYYRSLLERGSDVLTGHDYLWRWDTDWFWCSGAFGAQHPVVRRVWPRRYRRSDVYHRIIGFENRHAWYARLARARGELPRERVVQDIEVPLGRTEEFLAWYFQHVPMRPVWLCPIQLRSGQQWPLYPLRPGEVYVNVGFWGTAAIAPGAKDGDVNRAVEDAVTRMDGHKSLYSDAYYDRATFDRLYGGDHYRPVKERYDPDRRFPDLYEKAVRRT